MTLFEAESVLRANFGTFHTDRARMARNALRRLVRLEGVAPEQALVRAKEEIDAIGKFLSLPKDELERIETARVRGRTVAIGDVVTYCFDDPSACLLATIVADRAQHSIAKGRIAATTPMGRALCKCAVGDSATFDDCGAVREVCVLGIVYEDA